MHENFDNQFTTRKSFSKKDENEKNFQIISNHIFFVKIFNIIFIFEKINNNNDFDNINNIENNNNHIFNNENDDLKNIHNNYIFDNVFSKNQNVRDFHKHQFFTKILLNNQQFTIVSINIFNKIENSFDRENINMNFNDDDILLENDKKNFIYLSNENDANFFIVNNLSYMCFD